MNYPGTGLDSLDKIINYLRMGDNVVWQVDSIADYQIFVNAFVAQSLKEQKHLVYIRFASHPPLVQKSEGITIYELNSYSGFEAFSTELYKILTQEGRDVYYVFDSLSDLLSAWATDLMLSNFFMVTCPYLFELNTIAYFALIRNSHSFKTIARIRETTQLLLDVYQFESRTYVHPLKVWKRYSPTMFLPHVMENNSLCPITSSIDAAKLFSHISQQGKESSKRNLDYWDRLFMEVEELSRKSTPEESALMVDEICRLMLAKEEHMVKLVQDHFTLSDLLTIKSKLVGTGFIGGKALGMLLARNILTQDTEGRWNEILEPHDSFYIGSDVFYSFIVQNGWWKLRQAQKTPDGYFKIGAVLKEKFLTGEFPDEIKEQFQQLLEYYGQSPIIVRSSSLLEDSFGNAFAGKYDSYFLVNQGSPEERYRQFSEAVLKIYASTMNEDALSYRLQRGLEGHDEQMALLVQRVSGSHHTLYFFPDMAGVGISHNTYIWKKDMDPKAGVLRLVYGLGTRAVNRVDTDYPRIVALDMPQTDPTLAGGEGKSRCQREVDLLNIPENRPETIDFQKLVRQEKELNLSFFAVPDTEATRALQESGSFEDVWKIDFSRLLNETDFAPTMQKLMKTIESRYDYPVDIEFTVNFGDNGLYHINLLQCRPLQTRGDHTTVEIPENPDVKRLIFKTEGNFMGGTVCQPIKRIIAIDPAGYGELELSGKYEVARIIGKLNRLITDKEALPTLLIGPGRWGTSTPSLGIPIRFSEINHLTVLGEVAHPIAGLIPELSFGTHFFQDLVETGIFYISLFPGRDDTVIQLETLKRLPNRLSELLPERAEYGKLIQVIDFSDQIPVLKANIQTQKMIFSF